MKSIKLVVIIENKLLEYEEKLKLLYKKEKINDIIKNIDDSKIKEELNNLL